MHAIHHQMLNNAQPDHDWQRVCGEPCRYSCTNRYEYVATSAEALLLPERRWIDGSERLYRSLFT